MKKVILSEEILAVCPRLIVGVIGADVSNSEHSEALWQQIAEQERMLLARHTTEDIKNIPSIAATRRAYKRLGKAPSRYRPSGEQLMRRILSGKSLYHIDTLVDLINLASMAFGYSIGGFDESKIAGDTVTLGVGRKEEPYIGIGRGAFNIENMPVYRDAEGGIGTPTSDNERTKIEAATSKLLVFINGYDGDADNVRRCAEYTAQLLRQHCCGENIKYVSLNDALVS